MNDGNQGWPSLRASLLYLAIFAGLFILFQIAVVALAPVRELVANLGAGWTTVLFVGALLAVAALTNDSGPRNIGPRS